MIFNQGFQSTIFWLYTCYVLCNLGEDVASHHTDLSNEIYNLSWHLYPMQMQHSMILMMLNSQQSIYIKGFATFDCSRDTFKRVLLFLGIWLTQINFIWIFFYFSSIRLPMPPFRISWFSVVSTDSCTYWFSLKWFIQVHIAWA